MELDKRIKEGKKPLDCFDTKIAKQFIGKKGYFSHYIDNYEDLKNTPLGTLGGTGDTFHESFCCTEETFDNYYYEFFIPAEWVKESEKKFRAFTLAEWTDKHEIGEIIHFSYKDGRQEFNVMYTGYVIEHGEDIEDIRTIGRIMLMGTAYFLEDLFENYVICINGIWQPFGVMEDD